MYWMRGLRWLICDPTRESAPRLMATTAWNQLVMDQLSSINRSVTVAQHAIAMSLNTASIIAQISTITVALIHETAHTVGSCFLVLLLAFQQCALSI